MTINFKYSLGDTVKFKKSVHDDQDYITGHKIVKGRIFHMEISTGLECFGLKSQKPSICYKVQLLPNNPGWEYIHESSIVELQK